MEFGSDLKRFGYMDDGHPFVGEVFYVAVIHPEGYRWTLRHRIEGCRVHWDDENGCNHFEDTRPQAREACERIVARIKARGEINLKLWDEGRPVYGSAAFIEGSADL